MSNANMSEQTPPQTQSENRQSAVGDSSSHVSPVPPLANESDSGIGGMITAFIAIIALLASGYNYWKMQNMGQGETANVAVVDTDLIVSAYFAKNNNINNVEVLKDLQKINAIIDEQAANGVLVVKGSAVLGLPEQQDMTLAVANQLGLSDSDLSRALANKERQQALQEQQQSQINQQIQNQSDNLNNLGLDSSLD